LHWTLRRRSDRHKQEGRANYPGRSARLGLSEPRACKSAFNGRGPWWSSGASHMNQALPKKLWDELGLVSVLDTMNRLNRIA
jgi:hypothetical protein